MQLKIERPAALCVSLGLAIFSLPTMFSAQEQSPEIPQDLDAFVDGLDLYVMPQSGPYRPDEIEISNQDAISAWARSGHSDANSESFAHWNEDGEIPPVCATCHSGAGFRAFHGLDGSDPGPAQSPIPTGGVVDCETCHNPGLGTVDEIQFPSGLMHPVNSTAEASCMTCHQGRAAGNMISEAIETLDLDTPDPDLGFTNPHYAVAASTWLGGYGGSGYQYDGQTYSGRFFHARPVETCVSCHEPHTLQVAEETCATCHQDGTPDNIRLSRQSFDGSGDLEKGIRADIAANAELLNDLMVEYSATIAGLPMIYDGHSYPYFFADANADGHIDESDGRTVAYNAWTPRLLRAAYNWKFVSADAGAFAHNPHYALELLYDSIKDLAQPLGHDIDEWGLQR